MFEQSQTHDENGYVQKNVRDEVKGEAGEEFAKIDLSVMRSLFQQKSEELREEVEAM